MIIIEQNYTLTITNSNTKEEIKDYVVKFVTI